MPIAKQNFSHVTNFELEGVDLTLLTVDFINDMSAQTTDLSAGANTAGLEAVRATIMSRANILAEGPLTDSDTQKTYIVRSDSVNLNSAFGATAITELQAAIRAIPVGVCSVTITSATVTGTKLGILTAAAVAL